MSRPSRSILAALLIVGLSSLAPRTSDAEPGRAAKPRSGLAQKNNKQRAKASSARPYDAKLDRRTTDGKAAAKFARTLAARRFNAKEAKVAPGSTRLIEVQKQNRTTIQEVAVDVRTRDGKTERKFVEIETRGGRMMRDVRVGDSPRQKPRVAWDAPIDRRTKAGKSDLGLLRATVVAHTTRPGYFAKSAISKVTPGKPRFEGRKPGTNLARYTIPMIVEVGRGTRVSMDVAVRTSHGVIVGSPRVVDGTWKVLSR